MGFIRGGRFHFLFSAGLPLGERERGVDVPNTFQQLMIGTSQTTQPRDPGCVAARTSREAGAVTEPIMQYVLSPRQFPANFKRVSSRSLEPGVNFSFELTGDRGAALTTRHPTYNEDSQLDSAFREYTKRHYKSWVKFASDKKYGENLRPVLVSGFDMTKDFAIMAYSDNRTSVQSGTTVSTPMFGPAPASAWGMWHTACSPHVKHGPQQRRPPSPTVLPSLQSGSTESPTAEFNQCVFIRYYSMRLGLGFLPRVIRAGAGPHDLGSGENRSNAFPELTVRSDTDPMSGDEDPGGQWDPATSDSGSEPDTVIRNVPYVRLFACSSVSPLIVAHRIKNMTAGTSSRTTYPR